METVIVEKLSSVKEHLLKLWNEVGLNEDEKEDKMKILTSILMDQIKKFEEKEKSAREKQIRVIDETALKLYHLTNDLNILDVAEPDGHLTLRELEKYLCSRLVICQNEEEKRTSILKGLRKRENELCKILAEEPAALPPHRIPTYESLSFLKKAVNSLEKEYESREKSFNSFKASILAYMEELDTKPSTSLERSLLVDIDGLVTLSQKNLSQMKMLSKDLQLKLQQQKEKEEHLRDQIYLLWDRLSVSEERKEGFLLQLSSSTAQNIVMLECELQDLQALKRQNLGCFINKIRRELEDWWEKCFVSEDEKETFEPYFAEEYTDEVLESHEKEVQRFQDFYSQNEQLFLKINQWQKVWQKLTELDEKLNDPGRLFKNRGCALLQEEKERKRVNNELPRIENAIEQKISEWEEKNLKPFLVCGQPFRNFIKHNWQTYNDKKNREKQYRQETRSKQLERDARLGTCKTPPVKRNLLRSDTLHTSKFLRNNASQRTPSGASSSVLGSTLSHSSLKYNSVKSPQIPKRNPRSQRTRKASANPSGKDQSTFNSSDMSTYSKFTEGIHFRSERENIRSSVVPGTNLTYKSPNVQSRAWPNYFRKTPASASKKNIYSPARNSRLEPHASSNRPLPSAATSFTRRRSARLNPSVTGRTLLQSPKSPFRQSKLTTPIRNKLNILM